MAIVTISHEMGSAGSRIGMSVAERLHYRYVDRDLIMEAAQRYGCDAEKLARLDETTPSPIERFNLETRYYVTILQSVVLEIGQADNAVIMGRGGQILLRGIGHALRVFVGAPMDLRVKRETEGLGSHSRHTVHLRTAAERVRRSDKQKKGWMSYLFAVDWKDPALYDLMINTGGLSIESAVELIVSALNRHDLTPSEGSRQALRDRVLAVQVRCVLAAHPETRKYRITVDADHGIVRLESLAALGKAVEVARSVVGVVDVRTQPLEVFRIVPFLLK